MTPQERELQVIAMKMDDIKTRDILENHLHQTEMMREHFSTIRVVPQCLRTGRHQFRSRHGITAGEEGDFVAEPDEFLRQIRYDALRSAVPFRRHTFIKRSNLGYSHGNNSSDLGGWEQ